jgi:hypothetical protein
LCWCHISTFYVDALGASDYQHKILIPQNEDMAMTKTNAALANDTAHPETHRSYEFGNFQEREILEINVQLEPEVQAGMLAFLRAVVIRGVAMKEAEPLFAQVVQEFRAGKVA